MKLAAQVFLRLLRGPPESDGEMSRHYSLGRLAARPKSALMQVLRSEE